MQPGREQAQPPGHTKGETEALTGGGTGPGLPVVRSSEASETEGGSSDTHSCEGGRWGGAEKGGGRRWGDPEPEGKGAVLSEGDVIAVPPRGLGCGGKPRSTF